MYTETNGISIGDKRCKNVKRFKNCTTRNNIFLQKKKLYFVQKVYYCISKSLPSKCFENPLLFQKKKPYAVFKFGQNLYKKSYTENLERRTIFKKTNI